MNSEKNIKNLKREFIKSLSVMVLALTLLVTATVAWFTVTDTADVAAFTIAVESDDGGIYLGDGTPINRSVVLPAATKVDDEDISVVDFAKVIHIETFTVKASQSVTKAVVTVEEDHTDLHYFIVERYDPETHTVEYIADDIKDSLSDFRDQSAYLNFSQADLVNNTYQRNVAVVFWADYNDTNAEAIKNGELIFDDVVVRFTSV